MNLPSSVQVPSTAIPPRVSKNTLLFVGGASFNSLRATAEDSRRIEFKLEFKTRQERREEQESPPPPVDEAALAQALDPNERCPIFSR